jgi:glycosyltransferase involved in cell wall biosynthesis
MTSKRQGERGAAVRVGVVLSFSGRGGVERMVLRLLGGLQEESALPLAIDLVAIRAGNLPEGAVPGGVRLVDLGLEHSSRAAGALAGYLRQYWPDALLVAKDRAIRSAVRARARAGTGTRLIGRLGTHLGASLEGKHPLQRWLRTAPMARIYRRMDHVVGNSAGVVEDLRTLTGLPADRVSVIRNPVVGPDFPARARAEVTDPWLTPGEPPLLLGVGRLTRQKDFGTFLRAVARVRRDRPVRALLLGEGGEEEALRAEADQLGLGGDFRIAGQVADPLPWMSRAGVVVLSSRWEGSPNVLTEAAALGGPVVATDCPSGPRELLGECAPEALVPVGDERALAEAIHWQLDHPTDPERLRACTEEYRLAVSARSYLEVLGIPVTSS